MNDKIVGEAERIGAAQTVVMAESNDRSTGAGPEHLSVSSGKSQKNYKLL